MNIASETINPFNITKATDFSNQEIADYWVDFHTGSGEDLVHYLSPSDLTPKYIIGSKGCGKTHLLRYYSFPLQMLRSRNSITSILENEKYIGLNIDLGAMNSARMFGCNIEEDQWDAIFGYYVELFVGINLLDIIATIFKALEINVEIETLFVKNIKELICYNKNVHFENNLIELKLYINSLKKNVDFHINNAALKRRIDPDDLKIKLSPGDLFFKIPHLLISSVYQLKEVKFIFILDELEKLREYQKIYINTLVWDKQTPTTFWIGARTYGFTTRKTKSGETLRNGSEIQEIRLDEIMKENDEKYKEFAINLCAKRLSPILNKTLNPTGDDNQKDIDKFFEPFDENKLFQQLSKRKELPHQRKFKNKLKEGIDKRLLVNLSVDQISFIFESVISSPNLLLEKLRILHFYKMWSKSRDTKYIIDSVVEENSLFNDNKPNSRYLSYQEKYRLDFLAQIIFENNLKLYPYSGLSSFIKISSGNPRAFLVILKEIFERSKLKHELPFESHKGIKLATQSIGIYQASRWFYEDTEAYGEDGKLLYKCIHNLAELLQGIRYSDKPSETSPSSFSYKPEKISEVAGKFISLAIVHRILIDVNGRHDKNSKRIEKSYQINRMLAPYFNLPISRRGIVPINESMMEVIFNPNSHSEFQGLYNDFISNMNAPFGENFQAEMF